jgi:multicomponent Na+:H+ antiporter subunit F
MSDFFLISSIVLSFLIFVCLYRGVSGPGFFNRIVAINVIGTKVVVVILLMGFVYGRVDMFVDTSLGYALLNFIGTLAVAKYIERKGAI